MRQTGIYTYFVFGFNYSIIKRSGLIGYETAVALEFLDEFFEYLQDLDLQVTALVAANLRECAEELRASDAVKVPQELGEKIKDEANKLDAGLDAELQLKKAYVLTKKRYPLESLLQKQSDLLAKDVFTSLSDTAKRDYQLACVQVALNQPTAAAFHLMRMLEEQVKVLYFAFKKTKRLEKPMWGPMTSQLRTKRLPKPSNKLLDHLDGMRVHFRNPTQHPQAFYSIDEAQDLLNQTISAINMIAVELPRP